MFNDFFVDQLISDGRIIKIGGGELATDDHYLVKILDNQGKVLSRATGYELEKVFIEAFQATPPRVTGARRIAESRGETLRENILTGFAAELMAMLTEAQEENEGLATVCEALTNYIVGMYASGGESLEVVIKARAAIARNRGD